jgi:hypothetical protein
VPGSLLAHLPKECGEGRIYVDLRKIVGDGAAAATLFEKIVLADVPGAKKAEDVLAVLKKGGLDPASTVKELAVCSIGSGTTLLAFGVDLSKASAPMDTIFEALELGEGKGKAQLLEVEGLSYVKNARGEVLGKVAPDVLVLAPNADRLAEAAKKPGGSEGFADATKHVAWIKMTGRDRVDGAISDRGDRFELVVTFAPSGEVGQQLARDPRAVVGALQQEAKRRAKRLAGTPIAALASVIESIAFVVEDGKVKMTARLPRETWNEVLEAGASMAPSQLQRLLQ